jgi:CDP-glucose 4,6-dehydratase
VGMNRFSLQEYHKKRVLVTGDTGFKGSWLCIWLEKLGADVTGFALPAKREEDNYTVSGLSSKIHHINGDIRNYEAIADVIDEFRPDIVFHLAAQALVLDSYRDPRSTIETNISGTLNVLEAIRNTTSVKAGVMVTSDKCYANQEWVHGYRETDPLGGYDPYSASKGAAEIVISSYTRSFFSSGNNPTAIASVRAGNVFGGGDWSENRIIPDCIRALSHNQPIVIRNPRSVRPWQHVLDPLYGYLTLGSALCTEGNVFSGPWNFGPGPRNTVPVEDLVKELIRVWGSGGYTIEHHQDENKESGMVVLDINKANRLLGWHPVLRLAKALQMTIEEYKIQDWPADAVYTQRCNHIDEYIKCARAV